MINLKQCYRFYTIVKVLLQYGLDELIPAKPFTRSIRLARRLFFWIRPQHQDQALGIRIRLALQTLGPIWIKFGQMLSTRRDLFSAEMADQLALLQDQVEPFDSEIARREIEQALGGDLSQWFDDFNPQALASASIAQVHTAKFNPNQPEAGQEVVIKVIRPAIRPIIEADIALMYKLARLIPRLSEQGRRLRAEEVVREYEKTLLAELDLRQEMANAVQLRRNFAQSEMLYIPKMYEQFCRQNVIVMERIYGISVSDIEGLKQNGTNMQLLAERGVQVFFTQVFRDSFFHADMHAGNIFVSYQHPENPQYIGIDCGIVGSLNQEDKRYLAENFLAFFNRDYHRVAQLHIDSGWVPADTNVQELEQAFRVVCEPIFAKPLAEISFGQVLLNLFNTARRFQMEVQPQLVLLQKTLLYIEGLGRQLYPQLDLWQTAKPFLQQWLNDQIGVKAMYRNLQEKMPYFRAHFADLPETLYQALQQQSVISQQLTQINQRLQQQAKAQQRQRYCLVLTTLLWLGTLSKIEQLPLWLSLSGFILGGIFALLGLKKQK
ncbi:ubiquinone biosynthesis regulatory protein kinase UbiB [Mergibacter septicus]|nr:ubiquinone biosynthesis regulatory protein kinase UbiB [Mergibacter septicus]AWX13554.1 ubiquinone biosynthesis regulatory protein kinase UbiB [Mergibacter septicus]